MLLSVIAVINSKR